MSNYDYTRNEFLTVATVSCCDLGKNDEFDFPYLTIEPATSETYVKLF